MGIFALFSGNFGKQFLAALELNSKPKVSRRDDTIKFMPFTWTLCFPSKTDCALTFDPPEIVFLQMNCKPFILMMKIPRELEIRCYRTGDSFVQMSDLE